jgi:hypothetical protein
VIVRGNYQLGKLIDKREFWRREKQRRFFLRGLSESLQIQSNNSRCYRCTRAKLDHFTPRQFTLDLRAD